MAHDKREKILETSLHMFSRHGYFDTSTKEIARCSGVTESTLFSYFTSKAALYCEVMRIYSSFDIPELEALNGRLSYSDLKKDLFDMALVYYQATFTHIDILRIFAGKISAAPEYDGARFLTLPQLSEHYLGYLAKMAEKKIVPVRDYSVDSEVFVCYITRTVMDLTIHEHVFEMNEEVGRHLSENAEKLADVLSVEIMMDNMQK
ncbi:MAG TPA: TetR/AcrR family transcriptional regulator [Oscillospiraceae bacterium]|nr:TetR/AcrR family transcriptional regulator [Oscillospiraceae bacterium]